MRMSSATSKLPRSLGVLIGSSLAATLIYTIAKQSLRTTPKIVLSPREAVLKLTNEEQHALPYPLDAFPGARDIASPYGSIRVYEFGPEGGRKVLLIHGISTPCIALSGIAHGLASKGCRVLIFDLFGRGYSDTPDLPHDSRLYISQILLAITSSPSAWTPGGFSIVGYSFGGGIAVDFAASFPELVKGIVLMAPGGLIRKHHYNRQSRIMFSGWVPDGLLERVVSRRLGGSNYQRAMTKTGNETKPTTSDEIKGNRDPKFEATVLSSERPDVTIGSVVEWQLRTHGGFVKSFISSMQHGSIEGKQETWKQLGQREDKVMIIAGSDDAVISAVELREDAMEAIGEEHMEWRVVKAGHEFPVSRADEVLGLISHFWHL